MDGWIDVYKNSNNNNHLLFGVSTQQKAEFDGVCVLGLFSVSLHQSYAQSLQEFVYCSTKCAGKVSQQVRPETTPILLFGKVEPSFMSRNAYDAPIKNQVNNDCTMKKLVLCIDLGSSSVRCSLFEMEPGHNLVLSVAKPWEAVRHGKIQWWQPQPQQDDNSKDLNSTISLLDLVDQSMDELLEKLASSTSTGSEESSSPQIVAVGFSSLVMNLIGVDQQGNVIPQATLSYACNDALVATKVKALQRYVAVSGHTIAWLVHGLPSNEYANASFP